MGEGSAGAAASAGAAGSGGGAVANRCSDRERSSRAGGPADAGGAASLFFFAGAGSGAAAGGSATSGGAREILDSPRSASRSACSRGESPALRGGLDRERRHHLARAAEPRELRAARLAGPGVLLDLARLARRELAEGELEEAVAELVVGHRLALLAAPPASGVTPIASSRSRSASRAYRIRLFTVFSG